MARAPTILGPRRPLHWKVPWICLIRRGGVSARSFPPTIARNFSTKRFATLLAQTEPPHEIIVIDDGSTDDTASVIAKFGPPIRYRRIENSGAPVARNVGAAMATGDWLWFCDSDDLWRPEFLARIRAIAETPPYPAFIFGNFQLVRDGNWEAITKFATAPDGFWEGIASRKAEGGAIFTEPLYPHLLKFQPIFPSTIVMKKSLFESVGGFDAKFARTASEDFEFTLRCVAEAPVGMIETSLVGVRRHHGNFSANQLKNLLGEVKILTPCTGRTMPPRSATSGEIDADIRRRNLEALELAFSNGDYDLVRSLATRIGTNGLGFKPRLKVISRLIAEFHARTPFLLWPKPRERIRHSERKRQSMSRARILHVFKYFRPQFTGEGIFVERLAREFARLRPDVAHDVAVTATAAPANPVVPEHLSAVHYLSGAGGPAGQGKIVAWLAAHAGRYDAVHYHTHVDRTFAASLLLKLRGCRLILSATLDDSIRRLASDLPSSASVRLVRRLCRIIDQFVAISPEIVFRK